MSDGTRTCSACGESKPSDQFYPPKGNGLRLKGMCKGCIRAANYREPSPRACVVCGGDFKPKRRHDAKCCSRKCAAISRRGRVLPRKDTKDAPDGFKWCRKCDATLPLGMFRVQKCEGRADRIHPWCNPCRSKYQRDRTRRALGIPVDAPKMQGARPSKPDGYTIPARGGRDGYILEKRTGHHRGDKYGWVFQHILVAEEKYGFPITRDYTVHHRNGNRSDNRPENLELRYGNHGKGADVIDALMRIPEMRERAIRVLEGYGAIVMTPPDLPHLAG